MEDNQLSAVVKTNGPLSYNLYQLVLKFILSQENSTKELTTELNLGLTKVVNAGLVKVDCDDPLERDTHSRGTMFEISDGTVMNTTAVFSTHPPESSSGSVDGSCIDKLSNITSNYLPANNTSSASVCHSAPKSVRTNNSDGSIDDSSPISTSTTTTTTREDSCDIKYSNFREIRLPYEKTLASLESKEINISHLVAKQKRQREFASTAALSQESFAMTTQLTSEIKFAQTKSSRHAQPQLLEMETKLSKWASKMYIHASGPIISLMSKESAKEIVPVEGAGLLVMRIHTLNGQRGELHLTAMATIAIYKLRYTFGEKDFGITEDFARKIILKCSDDMCSFKNSPYATDKMTLAPKELVKLLPVDQFYQDIAQIIVVKDHHERFGNFNPALKRSLKKSVAAVKRAGNPLYYGRTQKRKIIDGKQVAEPRRKNPAEDMPLTEAYDCLVMSTELMRKEFINTCNGERRHYDNLVRSIMASQVLLRRCQVAHRQLLYRQENKHRNEQQSKSNPATNIPRA